MHFYTIKLKYIMVYHALYIELNLILVNGVFLVFLVRLSVIIFTPLLHRVPRSLRSVLESPLHPCGEL